MSFFGYGDGYRTYLIRLDAISMISFCEGKRDDIPDANAELEITAGGMHSHNIRGAFAREAFERLKAELGIEDGTGVDGFDEADASQEPYMSAATRKLVLQGIEAARAGNLVPGPDLGTGDDPEESTNASASAMLNEANAAWAALRKDPVAWAEELAERELWDATLADGLEADDGSPDATPSDPMSSNFDDLPTCITDADVTFRRQFHGTRGECAPDPSISVKATVKLAASPVRLDEGHSGESRPLSRTKFLIIMSGPPKAALSWHLATNDLADFCGLTLTVLGTAIPLVNGWADGCPVNGWCVFAELIA